MTTLQNKIYEEIAELQSLAQYIDNNDTLLLEWAGVLGTDRTIKKQYIK